MTNTAPDTASSSQLGHRAEFQGTIAQRMVDAEPWWRPVSTPPAGAPNVVVIVTDDMGYSDIGPFGSEIPTPHLDAVAAEGLRLANFHTTPVCSPTRASLMTGCNPHAVGFGFTSNIDPGFPGYTGELPANQPTVAEILRDNGYSTLMVGKWHLCKDLDMGPSGDRHSWPLQRGFQQFYGFLEAQTNFHQPHRMYEGNTALDVEVYPDDYYLTDDLTDRAIAMIHEAHAAEPDRPFLLYFGHGAAHTPLHAKPDQIAAFHGKYAEGWDALREQRLRRQHELGLIPEDAPEAGMVDGAGDPIPAWDDLTEDGKRLAARYMEVFAAMVASIDESTGRIRETLASLGLLDNTIFLFLSDNGAATGGGQHGRFNHMGGMDRSRTLTEDDHVALGLTRLDEIGGPTSWPAYAEGWASLSNTPFHHHKFTSWRGGHQVPCLLSWPRGIGEQAGQVRTQYGHVSDILPTLLDLIGLAHPGERNGQRARDLDGVSLRAVLESPSADSPHTEQYFECMGHRAFVRDEWEVVTRREARTDFATDEWALFNVENDPAQTVDVAADHPEIVDGLRKAWEEAAHRNQVYPMHEGGPIFHFQKPPSEERFCRPVTLFPQSPSLERNRSMLLIDGRSFTIEVAWDFRPGSTGVLFAHGGQEGGYLAYVENDHLHFVQNRFATEMLSIAPIPLPESSQRISFDVTAPGEGIWLVDISLDGVPQLTGAEFAQMSWLNPWNGIDIGRDRRSPVSWEVSQQHGTFPFTGTLHSVTYVPGELAPDAMTLMVERYREAARAAQ